jgi:hypothetical protein
MLPPIPMVRMCNLKKLGGPFRNFYLSFLLLLHLEIKLCCNLIKKLSNISGNFSYF